MPDETVLRAKARERICTGKLPSRRPDRTWGGPGVGVVCTVCDELTSSPRDSMVELILTEPL